MTDPSQLLALAAAGRSEELRTALAQQLANQEGVDPSVQRLLSQALAEQARGADAADRDLNGGDLDTDYPDDDDRDGDDRDRIRTNRGPGHRGDDDPAASRRRRHALWLLRERFADMQVELEELRERNEALAAALGACARCWGADPGCEVCAGRGVPGSRPPRAALFAYFVAPAVRRRQDVDYRARPSPGSGRPAERSLP